ncbi:peptidase C39 [Nitrosomonas sp. HPC101]|uniref:C39 family peptidase n=1 Tax=Nitrosomonas sp. HPC101 TaxID=1658667 RepID=UPI00136D32EA|nr:C39 family peptidase [Nitrosomonas sp. HPC101]MXS86410.1 peptidase C39 [Nitrosomonas sp. HPC101]
MKLLLATLTLLGILIVPCSEVSALDMIDMAGGANFNIRIKSFAERRFNTVYRQQYDFSCGSAALASLLTFHFDDTVDEQSVFVDMFQHGNQEKIRREGFSMLDMKRYLERRGYRSDGFKIDLNKLHATGNPAITIINHNGYMHFVIIKGVDEDRVLVGDPAQGVKSMNRSEFEEMWGNRILFLIHANRDPEVSYQKIHEEWAGRVAPLGEAVDRTSLGVFNVLHPGPWDF